MSHHQTPRDCGRGGREAEQITVLPATAIAGRFISTTLASWRSINLFSTLCSAPKPPSAAKVGTTC